ncbi:MrpH family fimbial adhesin [Erwinia sp. V71]|uniref:MrpH family fimbial adhesin n=1 Tax=Erwinia sp. V71 TaxID=3369424 RepID=UPI003F6109C9
MLITLLILCPVSLVNAGAYVFPVLFNSACLQMTQQLLSWQENETDLNPCYQWPSCYAGFDVKYQQHLPTMYSSCDLGGHCIRIEQYRTRKAVMEAWRREKGLPYSGRFTVHDTSATCVGLFYIERPAPPAGSAHHAIQFPGSVCSELPPANQTCHVILSPEIDFGILNSQQINGVSREVSGALYCTREGSVKLQGQSLLGERHIWFDGARRNFYSTLRINHQDAAEGVSFHLLSNQPQSFTLSATLQAAVTPEAGSYTGNGIVFITYP